MPQKKHPLTVDDLWAIKRIGSPTLSPDGRFACASALRWFPDGKRIAFVSWVWPDLRSDKEQAKRKKERKESKVKACLTERKEYRFWDHWLVDGREPHVHAVDVVTGRVRDLLAGTGLALQ